MRKLRTIATVSGVWVLLLGLDARADVKITAGLEPYQVLQRRFDDKADIVCSGTASADGSVEARVLRDGKPLTGLDWRKVGEAPGGKWSARIKGVPTGGEYHVEIRVKGAGEAKVEHILVGDLWLLLGQSNMQGVGDLIDVVEPSPMVHSYEMRGRWVVAEEPLHHLLESPDRVHWPKDWNEQKRQELLSKPRTKGGKGAGLGMPFAREMVKQTGVPIGLVPVAHGGTSMAQWNPAKRDEMGGSLYGSMYRTFKAVGGRVKGVLWYQGESDANPEACKVFAAAFEALIAALRRDLGDPNLPFYYVQIGRFAVAADPAAWNAIQELQRVAPKTVAHCDVVATVDLSLDDLIHVSTPGLERLGSRLAKLALRDLFGKTQYNRGPRLASVTISPDRRRIWIDFDEVNGSLQPPRHIAGFSIRDKDGKLVPNMYDAGVDPSNPHRVVLRLQNPLGNGLYLWYGYGMDPYCNLRDSQDMAALVFGPAELRPAAR